MIKQAGKSEINRLKEHIRDISSHGKMGPPKCKEDQTLTGVVKLRDWGTRKRFHLETGHESILIGSDFIHYGDLQKKLEEYKRFLLALD